MRVSLLHTNPQLGNISENKKQIVQACTQISETDICLAQANALVGSALGRWHETHSIVGGFDESCFELAATLRYPLFIPSILPSYERPQPQWFLVNRGRVEIPSKGPEFSLYADVDVATIEYTSKSRSVALLFCTSKKPCELEDFWSDSMVSWASFADCLIVTTLLPWWRGFEEACDKTFEKSARSLGKPLLVQHALGCEDGVLYSGSCTLYAPNLPPRLLIPAFSTDETVVNVDLTTVDTPPALAPRDAYEQLWRALVFGTKMCVQHSGLSSVYLGLSGGIDSALVAVIACAALGSEHVHPVCMPSPYTQESSIRDAQALADILGLQLHNIPITSLLEQFTAVLTPEFADMPPLAHDTTFENVQARIRAVLLCALANRAHALIVNTSNKSELAMGYSTLYGDSIGAFSVLGDCFKTEVYALARWYNEHYPTKAIPEAFLTKAPSAELRPNQKDSDSLPPYEVLDAKVKRLFTSWTYDGAVDLRARCFAAEFKRRQSPFALVVSLFPFGLTWRIPIGGKLQTPVDIPSS